MRIYSKFDPVTLLIGAVRDVCVGAHCEERYSPLAYTNGVCFWLFPSLWSCVINLVITRNLFDASLILAFSVVPDIV